jgi:DNA replication protein DnaC
LLAALAEHEMADRGRRRIERHLASAQLPAGRTFDTFDVNAVPAILEMNVESYRRKAALKRNRGPAD